MQGIISIGWYCGSDLNNKNRDELSEILKAKYEKISDINISQVFEFIRIEKGSIILTPSIKNKRVIHIFKTITAYQYNKNNDIEGIGNPHFLEAEFIDTIDKDTLPEKIIRSLSGARKTVSNITQHGKIIESFMKNGNSIYGESEMALKDKSLKILEELTKSKSEEIRLKATIELLKHLN